MFNLEYTGGSARQDHIGPELDKLLENGRKSRHVPVGISTFNNVVPAFDVAELLHALRKPTEPRLCSCLRPQEENANQCGFWRHLAVRHRRWQCRAEPTKQRDNFPAPHACPDVQTMGS